jgi:hypothetical protein
VVCSLTHTHTRTHTYTHSCCPQYPALSLCQRPAHTHTHTHTHTHKHTLTFTHTHTGAAHNTQHFLCTSDQHTYTHTYTHRCCSQYPALPLYQRPAYMHTHTYIYTYTQVLLTIPSTSSVPATSMAMRQDCLIVARLTGSIQVYSLVSVKETYEFSVKHLNSGF